MVHISSSIEKVETTILPECIIMNFTSRFFHGHFLEIVACFQSIALLIYQFMIHISYSIDKAETQFYLNVIL